MPVFSPVAAVTNKRRKLVDPLRADPTKTTRLRARFGAEIKRRFRDLEKRLWEQLVTHNFLDLEEPISLAENAAGDFLFTTDPQKLVAFNDWFARQVQDSIFFVPPGTPLNEPWLADYVDSAYKRGVMNAWFSSQRRQDLLGPGPGGGMSQEQFLAGSFAAPESMAKVRLLAMRVLEDLKGVTNAMATEMSRILTQGLIDGKSAIPIAREMVKKIRGMTMNRAMVIVRTEIIRAHAEGQLDAYRRLGVEQLGLQVEFSTAGDDRVCPICARLEGKVYSIDSASGVIPVHPQCRCAWLPYIPTKLTKRR